MIHYLFWLRMARIEMDCKLKIEIYFLRFFHVSLKSDKNGCNEVIISFRVFVNSIENNERTGPYGSRDNMLRVRLLLSYLKVVELLSWKRLIKKIDINKNVNKRRIF